MEKEKIEYYTLRPNLKQIYGKKVTKETTFTYLVAPVRFELTLMESESTALPLGYGAIILLLRLL